MNKSINRMQFLQRGDVPIRPPWSLLESEFIERCERCDDCIKACDEHLLKKGRGGYPEIDFSKGGCTFCGDCLSACEGRALIGHADDEGAAWSHWAEISNKCLSVRGVVCRSCGEACEESAIRFQLEVGGIARPLLDAGVCTGCGECYAVCPVQAVRMLQSEPLQQAV